MNESQSGSKWIRIHSPVVRITHWLNALAILMMVTSGWEIYNASPIWKFEFPTGITLGGWLGGALQWHFAAMWLLVLNGLVYVINGFATGHFHRKLWPVTPGAVLRDVFNALRGRLAHADLSTYNAAQKAAYIALILVISVLVFSGLAIWKPVQLQWFTALLGGYDNARIVHFVAMSLVVLIVFVHVVMVVLVPKTFPSMITGRARRVA